MIKWYGDLIKRKNQEIIETRMDTAVLLVEASAKPLCPVDTGRLRSSITHEVTRRGNIIEGLVGTNVEYAKHVEFGTSRQRAQPYLRPALKQNMRRINKLFGAR